MYSPLSAKVGIIWLGGLEAKSLLLAIASILFFSKSLSFFDVFLIAPFLLSVLSEDFFQRSYVLIENPNTEQALSNLAPFILACIIRATIFPFNSGSNFRPLPPTNLGLFFGVTTKQLLQPRLYPFCLTLFLWQAVAF